MYRNLQRQLANHVRSVLKKQYDLELTHIGVDQPPNVALGEYALTFCFELAKKLRKPPRKIAEEVIAALGVVEGFEKFEMAGAGYINARLDRSAFAAQLITSAPVEDKQQGKVLVEHTSINPNKAAHIGHLRNAILGDTFVRLLRSSGQRVDVQNYIDNTGVQVADVVVGLVHLEKKSKAEITSIIAEPGRRNDLPFDYYCWDLYARVSTWYEDSAENKAVRLKTLHDIEEGKNEIAQIAEIISIAVLRRHLETMERLGIRYDFLPRESEILSLHFWDLAFEQLKVKGVLYLESEGKNKGCWVMRRAGSIRAEDAPEGPDEDAKVIVRSNGTVTYVGKDIAYHLWKFGLLGRDFGYQRFFCYSDGQDVWISASTGENDHPHFGGVAAIYNVIDSRQSDPQNNVIEALRALGHLDQAEHYTHFSYEMVALTPRCALELGYSLLDEDRDRAYIEVSGRKGFGVKADDLLDALIEAAQTEVNARHAQRELPVRRKIAEQIAIGALRYFMLKYTKNSVIAFDFKDALSFEGETGPYCQYAVVRAANIFRKGETTPTEVLSHGLDLEKFLAGEENNDIWELWLATSKLSLVVEQCIAMAEPAYLAKYAFQLAQLFNNFYHRHHILHEQDEERKRFLMATAGIVQRELLRTLALMGVDSPEVM